MKRSERRGKAAAKARRRPYAPPGKSRAPLDTAVVSAHGAGTDAEPIDIGGESGGG